MTSAKFQRVIKFEDEAIYKQLKTAAIEDNLTIGNEIKHLLTIRENYKKGMYGNKYILKS